jgi:hypothetical protein
MELLALSAGLQRSLLSDYSSRSLLTEILATPLLDGADKTDDGRRWGNHTGDTQFLLVQAHLVAGGCRLHFLLTRLDARDARFVAATGLFCGIFEIVWNFKSLSQF